MLRQRAVKFSQQLLLVGAGKSPGKKFADGFLVETLPGLLFFAGNDREEQRGVALGGLEVAAQQGLKVMVRTDQ